MLKQLFIEFIKSFVRSGGPLKIIKAVWRWFNNTQGALEDGLYNYFWTREYTYDDGAFHLHGNFAAGIRMRDYVYAILLFEYDGIEEPYRVYEYDTLLEEYIPIAGRFTAIHRAEKQCRKYKMRGDKADGAIELSEEECPDARNWPCVRIVDPPKPKWKRIFKWFGGLSTFTGYIFTEFWEVFICWILKILVVQMPMG